MFRIPYTDFSYRNAQVKNQLMNNFEKVLDSGIYVLGSEVSRFEDLFSKYVGTKFAVGLSNGTCSLHLSLRTLGLQPGDEIITPTNSFVASTSSIVIAGFVPVLVDADDDMNIDVNKIEEAISPKTRAIMVVHLTGRPARMDPIMEIAAKYSLIVVEDSAQSIGARYKNRKIGTFGTFASFSLHPLKNLHGYGDSGVITTDSSEINERLRIVRNHGLVDRESCADFSYNCRIDELQASLINVNISKLDEWTAERRQIASVYNEKLREYVVTPEESIDEFHVYQTYVIRALERDKLLAHLRNIGIEATVHYKTLIHKQEAIKKVKSRIMDVSNSEKLSQQIMSLPLYPGLSEEKVNDVTDSIIDYLGKNEIPRPL